MKRLTSHFVCLAFALAVPAFAAESNIDDNWYNRPNVIRAASTLATEIEHLDETLHDAKAPAHFIQKVHHTEETVTEFLLMVRQGVSYNEAYQEFNHIREDMKFITNEFASHPHLLSYPNVANEWRHTRSAYRRLDHEMFRHLRNRFTADQLAELDRELQELESHQAALAK